VLLYHGESQLFFPTTNVGDTHYINGHYGVDFFFVLSGFVISSINYKYIGLHKEVGAFLVKRLVRILPLVFLLCAPRIFVEYLQGRDFVDLIVSSTSDLLLLPTERGHLINSAWSLRFEMFFYFLFAIGLLFTKKLFWFLSTCWLILIVSIHVFAGGEHAMYGVESFMFSKWNVLFIFGFYMGFLEHSVRKWPSKFQYLLVFFSSTIGFIFMFCNDFAIGHPDKNIYDVIGASFLFCGVTQFFCCLDYRRVKPPRILIELGNASYALYLIHGSVLFYCRVMLDGSPLFLCLTSWLLVLLILPISWLVYQYYEKPVSNYLRRKLL